MLYVQIMLYAKNIRLKRERRSYGTFLKYAENRIKYRMCHYRREKRIDVFGRRASISRRGGKKRENYERLEIRTRVYGGFSYIVSFRDIIVRMFRKKPQN